MDKFEELLGEVRSGVERFVRYRLPSQTDADDVLQEVYLSAYRKFAGLKNKDACGIWNTPISLVVSPLRRSRHRGRVLL